MKSHFIFLSKDSTCKVNIVPLVVLHAFIMMHFLGSVLVPSPLES